MNNWPDSNFTFNQFRHKVNFFINNLLGVFCNVWIRDDIAVAKGIDFNELLDEIEAIVYSGTKLNIDYFLNDVMDEDHMLDIYDYFKESTTDKIDDAMDELGADYTEEEIRLVRIKFISEMAN